MHTFCAAKLLQIFGMYKELTIKIKFDYIFSGKYGRRAIRMMF